MQRICSRTQSIVLHRQLTNIQLRKTLRRISKKNLIKNTTQPGTVLSDEISAHSSRTRQKLWYPTVVSCFISHFYDCRSKLSRPLRTSVPPDLFLSGPESNTSLQVRITPAAIAPPPPTPRQHPRRPVCNRGRDAVFGTRRGKQGERGGSKGLQRRHATGRPTSPGAPRRWRRRRQEHLDNKGTLSTTAWG